MLVLVPTDSGPSAYHIVYIITIGVVLQGGTGPAKFFEFNHFRPCIVFYTNINFILLQYFALLKQRAASVFPVSLVLNNYLPETWYQK